jgi:hypothetical protein
MPTETWKRALFAASLLMFVYSLVGMFAPMSSSLPLWSADLRRFVNCDGSAIANYNNRTPTPGRIITETDPTTGMVTRRAEKAPQFGEDPVYCRQRAQDQVTKLGVIAFGSVAIPALLLWITHKKPDPSDRAPDQAT